MAHLEKILFATDFSENSEHAFDYALSLARQFNAKLFMIHVINEPVDLRGFYVPHISFEKLEKEIEEGAEKMMQKFCRNKIKDFTNYETLITAGIPYDEILKKPKRKMHRSLYWAPRDEKGSITSSSAAPRSGS